MNAKIAIAGVIWLVLALISLIGLFGLLAISVIEPTLFSYWYISLLTIPISFIFLILFIILALGLFLEKKWSFKLGIAVPVLDIIISGMLSVLLLTIPNIVPAGLNGGIEGTAIIAIIEILALVLVLKSKNKLTK